MLFLLRSFRTSEKNEESERLFLNFSFARAENMSKSSGLASRDPKSPSLFGLVEGMQKLFFFNFLLFSQLLFCQSKKEKLQKKVAFLGYVEAIPLRKWLKTAESGLKRGNALRLDDLAS